MANDTKCTARGSMLLIVDGLSAFLRKFCWGGELIMSMKDRIRVHRVRCQNRKKTTEKIAI